MVHLAGSYFRGCSLIVVFVGCDGVSLGVISNLHKIILVGIKHCRGFVVLRLGSPVF